MYSIYIIQCSRIKIKTIKKSFKSDNRMQNGSFVYTES